MPVPTESVLKIPSLTADILNDGKSGAVPEDVYEESVKPLIDELIAKGIDPKTKFDPAKHIIFTEEDYEKTQRLTLKDLMIDKPHQEPITDIGVSAPFPLFSDEAVDLLRYEILNKEYSLHAGRVSDVSNTGDMDFYVRGNCEELMPFTAALWNHPKTLEIMSRMSDVELVHMNAFELGSANVSIRSKTTKLIEDEEEEDLDPEKISASVTWHYDSPQHVCVLMLSDTTNMIGGETALMMGNGKIAKAVGPKKGWGTILQARVIRHLATKPRGNFSERIVSVASFRPADPMKDNCFMTTIKPSRMKGSRYNDWYKAWMEYRLEVLGQRIKVLGKKIEEKFEAGEYFDQLATIEFLQKNIIEYAEHTYQEFEAVDDGLVPKPASYNAIKARWD